MAFFKFQWPGRKGDGAKAAKSAAAPRTENIDAMRRRARHRLIGAAVLVLLAVVGFPMLFDTQPRPIPVDTPIEIPDRNQVAPLVVPAASGTPPATAPAARVADGLADGEELVPSATVRPKPAASPAPAAPVKPEPRPEPKVAKPEPKHEPKPQPEPRPEPKEVRKPEPAKPAPHADDAARARALLEGRATPAAPAVAASAQEGRFIVQIGAFADADKAKEVRQKLERAGLKSYTQVVTTKEGQRTRVRVGPFEGRDAADKAAARIKTLDLPASVLTL